jgi:hypothetical protein
MNTDYNYGNCMHEVNANEFEGRKFVQLYNDDDSHYATQFDTREEVEQFIEKLRAAADEAFGPEATI